MNTFSLNDLFEKLIKHNAFIYHGAGIAKGIGNAHTNNLTYIQRLKSAITEDFEICCSTVQSGDSETNLNYWGRMGLILNPISPNSITLVSHQDAGTTPDPHRIGKRAIPRVPITLQDIENSITQRQANSCNEWCVLSYSVFGIFIEPPIQYVEDGNLLNIEVKDVFNYFPSMRVFAFYNQHTLREILPPGNWGSVIAISEIYK